MEIREVGDLGALSGELAEGWRRLAQVSGRATPFQTFEWLAAWRAGVGRGGKLVVLELRERAETVGIAPFVSRGKVWTLAGQGGSDYLDLLSAPGRENEVCAALGAWLDAHKSRWAWLDLQQVRPGAAIESLPGVEAWPGETCPYLPLEPTWEDQRKAFGKKLRGNLGYYERALEKAHSLVLRLATPETLDADMDAFFLLHQKRWRGRWMPGAFASERAREFHRAAARNLLDAGMLRLHLLELDGVVQAAIYCFHLGARTCYYLGGFEPTLARLSLGTVLTGRAIRHAIEADGAREFDFLRGDEPYKYKWGAQDRFNRRLVRTSGAAGAILAHGGRALLAAELKAKHAMHARHGNAKHGGDKTT